MTTYDDSNDPIRITRGLLLGTLLSLPFWALLIAGIAILL